MKTRIATQYLCFFALLALTLLSNMAEAQENRACENEVFPKTIPYPPTLCEQHQQEPWPKPIELGVEGWKTDLDVFLQTGEWGLHCISMYDASDGYAGEHYFDNNDFHLAFNQTTGMSYDTRAISITGGIHPNTENSIIENDVIFENVSSQAGTCIAVNVTNGDYNNLSVGQNKFHHTYDQLDLRGEQGIRLVGSTGSNNSVVGNIFDDLSTDFSRAYDNGILSADFDNTDYQYNHVRECKIPFYFHGMNEHTQLVCNTLEGGSELLKLELSVIGTQGMEDANGNVVATNGNKWLNTLEPNALDGNCTPALAFFSKFLVTGQQSATNPFFPDQLLPATNWFKGDGPNSMCAFQLKQYDLEKSIASGAFGEAINNKADAWEARRYLYNRLAKDEEMLASFEGFQQFMAEQDGSTLAELSKVQRMIEDAYVPADEQRQVAKQLNEDITGLLDEAKTLDEQIYQGQGNELSPQRKEVQEKVIGKTVEVDDLGELVYAGIKEKLLAARSFNEQIQVTEVWEANTKTMNEMVIDLALNQGLTEGQWEKVRAIAAQCPREGGMAVYKARGILPDCEIRPELHETICFPASQRDDKKEFASSNIMDMHLLPNPNTGSFTVKTGNQTVSSISVLDALGKTILVRSVAEATGDVQVNHDFVPGTYFCRVQTLAGERIILTFIVTK